MTIAPSPDAQTSYVNRRLADTPIAIVGMSALLPGAPTMGDYWQNIVDGTDCTTEVPASRWSLDDYYDADRSTPDKTYSRRGAFVPDVEFDPIEFGMPPNQLEVTSTMQTLSLGVVRDLLADAGATTADGNSAWYDPSKTGVVVGTTGPVPLMHPLAARLSTPVLKEAVRSTGLSDADADAIAEKYVAAFAPWEENSFPGLLANVVAGRIANRFGLGGINCTVDAACAASLAAIRTAIAELVDGRADTMITGGVDTENSIFIYLCFSKVGALSPTGQISPFADNADGTLLGEGIAMLALRRLDDARRDGNRVYAVIKGLGSSSDGRSKSIYAPHADGQQVALRRAYADARVDASSIELFEAHATGTAVGDKTELTALGAVLRADSDENSFAALGSVKSQIGHTKGAAGTASLMKLALGLYHKVLPGTINVDRPNAVITADSPYYVNSVTRPWILDPHRPVRRAAVSAMGFGGTNFHLVLEEADADRSSVRPLHQSATAGLWHAADVPGLIEALSTEPGVDGGDIPAHHVRVGFVWVDDEQRERLRELAIDQLGRNPDATSWSHPEGIHFRDSAKADLAVGALFAGQGSQYVTMGAAAALAIPSVAAAFDDANRAFDGAPRRLGSVVFPPPAFDDETADADEDRLRQTEYAQPAIGAVSAGLYRYLNELGLTPTAFAGHSFGELTALWAAGSLDTDDFFTLARARGAAMAPRGDGDAGTMLAVRAGRDEVDAAIATIPDLHVCNHNAPDQVVIGGGTPAVEGFEQTASARGWNTRRLPVSAAFHTPYVAHASESFGTAVRSATVSAPRHPVFGNDPTRHYGTDTVANADILVDQLMQPVEFVSVLEGMREAGCTVFVEFGPKQVLTSLVRRTLGDDVIAIPTDMGPMGDGDLGIKRAAVQLAVLGMPLQGINRHQAAPAVQRAPGKMSVTISAPEYVPAARAKAYADTLDNGYQVVAPAAPTPSVGHVTPSSGHVPPSSGHVTPSVGHQPPAPIPTPPPAPAPTPPPAPARHHQETPMSTAHSSPNPGSSDPGHLGNALTQHLDTHREFLGTQLSIARGLAAALAGDRLDDTTVRAIEAVSNQSVALSDSHTQAAHVLAGLAELEAGLPVSTGTRTVTTVPSRQFTSNGTAPQAITPSSAPAIDRAPAPATATPAPAAAPAPVATPTPVAPPTPAPAPVAPAFVAPEPEPAPSGDHAVLTEALREVIADKTGYPVDMIDTTMDLESDLGVDSIKRVQVLGAVQERFPHLPSLGPERLGELRTIDDIVAVIAVGSDADPKAPAAEPRHSDLTISTERTAVGVVALPDIDVAAAAYRPAAAALIVTIGATVDAPIAGAVAHQLSASNWGTTVLAVAGADELDARLGEVNVTDLVVLVLDSPEPATAGHVQSVLTEAIGSVRALIPTLTEAADGRAALITVTTVDGCCGFGDIDTDPVHSMSAGVGGLVKTLAAEHPSVFARAVDLAPDLAPEQAAQAVVAEIHDAATDTLEVGVDALGRRVTVVPSRHGDPAVGLPDVTAAPLIDSDITVGADDLLVVSGGARGVTALCVIDLARHCDARFLLLGRSERSPDPDWAHGVADDALQRAAITALAPTGANPRAIGRACATIRADREIAKTLAALGDRATYLSIDVTDADAVRTTLEPYRHEITGIIHGAGVLADAPIARKTRDEIDRVLTTKIAGLTALLAATDVDRLRHLVLFTSIAGLFGNTGQSDYATANEALVRFAASFKRHHPDRHVTAIDWGAWDAGMVDDALRAHFAAVGVSLLEPATGTAAFVEQFTTARADDVAVLIGTNSPLFLGDNGTDTDIAARRPLDDLAVDPIIADHTVGTRTVLPATFAIGAMANIVERATPGRTVVGLRDVRVLSGVTVASGDGDPITTALDIAVSATADPARVAVRVTSDRAGRAVPHYTATILVADHPTDPPATHRDWPIDGIDAGYLYREGRQFHGPALHGMVTVLEESDRRLVVRCGLPDSIIAAGAYRGRLHDPLLADLILQVPPVLALASLGSACLPMGVGAIDLYRPLPANGSFTVVADNVRVTTMAATVDARAVDDDGRLLQSWRDIAVVAAPDLSAMFADSVRRWSNRPDTITSSTARLSPAGGSTR